MYSDWGRPHLDGYNLATGFVAVAGLAAGAAFVSLLAMSALIDQNLHVPRATAASALFGAALASGWLLSQVAAPACRLVARWTAPAEAAG